MIQRLSVDIVADDVILKQVRYLDGCQYAKTCLVCPLPECNIPSAKAACGNTPEGRMFLLKMAGWNNREYNLGT